MHRAMMLALGAGLLTIATLPFAETAVAAVALSSSRRGCSTSSKEKK